MSRNIFISPHPDDAIWSCGGRIKKLIQSNHQVLLITIFSEGQKFYDQNESWRSISSSAIRHHENQKAIRYFNLEHIDLGYVDAAARLGQDGYLYKDANSLFKLLHKDDIYLSEMIFFDLMKVLNNDDVINVPLGMGNHVDHVIVSNSAKMLNSGTLIWYEDFPYSLEFSAPLDYKPIWYEVDVNDWVNAGLCYRSQVLHFFKSSECFRNKICDYASLRGKQIGVKFAERCWV